MRKITKIRRSIRAISPVISVLLMIAIAVVASLVVYAWVMGYVGFQTSKVGNAVQIQSSAFSTDDTQLTVYVQNVGQGTEQLNYPDNTVYINSVAQPIVSGGVNPASMLSGTVISLPQGQTVGLTINYNYVPGQQLHIKIVTIGGTSAQSTSTGSSNSNPTPSSPPGNVAPTAAFTSVSTDLSVAFTDASTDSDGTIASWSWAFGDGATSPQQNPTHVYASANTYTVTLTVTDNSGSQSSTPATHDVTVAPGNVAPSADFTFSATNLVVQFTDTSTDSDGTIASRSWTFGDSQTSTDTNPSHTYASAGTYTVRLTVIDNDGGTDYQEYQVTVTAAPLPTIYVTSNSAVHDTNVGTHSSFANMKNVGTYDTITEADTDSTTGTMGVSGTSGSSYTSISGDDMAGQAFTAGGSGRIQSVTFYAESSSSWSSRNVKAVITDSSGTILTGGVSNAISVNNNAQDRTVTFANPPVVQSGQTYWIMIITDGTLYLRYSATTGGVSKADTSNSYSSPSNPTDATSGTYNYRRLYASINYDNYQLDQEFQFTGVTNYANYHHLEIQTGAYTGSENLIVQYWTGTAWADLTTNLPANTLTSLNVALTGTTFEIRLKDATTSGDTTQSTWQIDYARLAA